MPWGKKNSYILLPDNKVTIRGSEGGAKGKRSRFKADPTGQVVIFRTSVVQKFYRS